MVDQKNLEIVNEEFKILLIILKMKLKLHKLKQYKQLIVIL